MPAAGVSASAVHARRLRAQGLSGPPAASPVAVAEHLLAVQAQDARGMRLAVRSRTAGLAASDVEAELGRDGALVVTWLNRGTLHLVRRADLPWLHALTTPPLHTTSARRLAQEGVPPDAAERGVATIVRALGDDGPLPVGALRERVERAGVRSAGQAIVHLLLLATLRGLVVRGPVLDGGAQAHVLVQDWLGGSLPEVDRTAALAELARRYLAGHGPATDRDLARWAGIGLRDARAGLGSIAGALEHHGDGLVDLARAEADPALPPPRLLGAFDPVLLGWVSREDVVPPGSPVVTSNGVFRAIALVEGRAAATWSLAAGRVRLMPWDATTPEVDAALAAEADEVVRFLGA
jgi:hypothetical protein